GPVGAGPAGRGGDAQPAEELLALVLADGNDEAFRDEEADGGPGSLPGGPGPGVVDQGPHPGHGAGHPVVGGHAGGGEVVADGGHGGGEAAGGHHDGRPTAPEPGGGRGDGGRQVDGPRF